MASRGLSETGRLRANIEEQLNRLLTQMKDLEELKAELDEDEYESTKQDTVQQLKEFEASLNKMKSGDMTLIDDINRVQLAIQSAVSNAFKTPEVIRLFANKQPGQLRDRLAGLQRDLKLGRLAEDVYRTQAVEIALALQRLNEQLTPEEAALLESARHAFVRSDSHRVGDAHEAGLRSLAGNQIHGAQTQ
eukprot:GILK01005276.1.p1 GENE.GILK01005276.1~~GILK01005276.1.p1  ORF type:complete len:204 (+),score=45.35 GILK01005276.1:41-613(+)